MRLRTTDDGPSLLVLLLRHVSRVAGQASRRVAGYWRRATAWLANHPMARRLTGYWRQASAWFTNHPMARRVAESWRQASARLADQPSGHVPHLMATTVVVVLVLGSTASAGEGPGASNGGPVANPGLPAVGQAPEGALDALTVVAPDTLVDVEEHEESTEVDGVDVTISYPVLANADPLTDRLAELTEQSVADFVSANPGAEEITVDGNVTVAEGDIVGVRLTTEEVGVRRSMAETGSTRPGHDDNPRQRFDTLWYDAATGRVAGSTELLRDHDALAELCDLVREALAEEAAADVDDDSVLPVAGLFTSLGFNPRGDLVVEFGAGRVAPAEDGPVTVVVDRQAVQPLLSELGGHALAAATLVTPEFHLAEPAPAAPADVEPTAVPGMVAPVDAEVDCTAEDTKCVALTFDDGPGDGTDRLLDMLAEYDARATFFLTGGPVREHLPTVRREFAEGHELANHTMNHPDLTGLSRAEILEEVEPLQAMIRRETGHTTVLVRPPYGATNGEVKDVMAELGLAEIMWSIDTEDWLDRDSKVVAQRAVTGAEHGAIVLFHDIHDTTIDAIPAVLRELDEQGYTFVTVTQLLGETAPGQTYVDGVPAEPEDDEDEDEDEE